MAEDSRLRTRREPSAGRRHADQYRRPTDCFRDDHAGLGHAAHRGATRGLQEAGVGIRCFDGKVVGPQGECERRASEARLRKTMMDR